MQQPWLANLKFHVERHPIVVLRFGFEDWEKLTESRLGSGDFTLARPHDQVGNTSVPAPCLIEGTVAGGTELLFGLISSRAAVATLDTRIKVQFGSKIKPDSMSELLKLLTDRRYLSNLDRLLSSGESAVILTPKLSSHVIDRLAGIDANSGPLIRVVESLKRPKRFSGNRALQEDAVQTALKAFGLTSDSPATTLDLFKSQESAIARIPLTEDSVIEHDARSIPGFDLARSDLTGRAVFERGDERLEVFTANRRDLEYVFGVDLIYFNEIQQSIVMLQYKMLEPPRSGTNDWIYRPDTKLDEQIRRMQLFNTSNVAGSHEYKLNPAVFYLKFVKRDGSIRNGGFTVPVEHFEHLRNDPSFRGPKGGFRIGYRSLAGRYLRQRAFLDLLSSGYIGSNVNTTAVLKTLIEAVLANGRAVVAAHQSSLTTSSIGT